MNVRAVAALLFLISFPTGCGKKTSLGDFAGRWERCTDRQGKAYVIQGTSVRYEVQDYSDPGCSGSVVTQYDPFLGTLSDAGDGAVSFPYAPNRGDKPRTVVLSVAGNTLTENDPSASPSQFTRK